jgi:cob(I)alamin adenosyltransferase
VVLDELHAALRHRLVGLDDVLAAISARPSCQEVVTTGRGAPEGLLAAADLVTEMTPIRHPYPDVPARRGVEL